MKPARLAILLICVSALAHAQSSDENEAAQAYGQNSEASSAAVTHGWSSNQGRLPGRMTEHGWVAGNPDCSLNGTQISGSAGLRCMH